MLMKEERITGIMLCHRTAVSLELDGLIADILWKSFGFDVDNDVYTAA